MKLMKSMKTNPVGDDVMFPAWYGLILFCYENRKIRQAFFNDTGIDIQEIVQAKGLNKMIDESTGRTEEALVAFADWVTVNYWGEE